MSTLKERLSAQMRRGRAEKDLTQAQLADLVGVSYKLVNQIERGINAPSFEVLARIVQVLELDGRTILNEPDKLLDEERRELERKMARVAARLPNDRLEGWLKVGAILAGLK